MMVRRAMGLDCDNFYNVAVVGAAGTGKVGQIVEIAIVIQIINNQIYLQSSLVNGILGYPDGDRYSAPINEAGKQLDEPRGYRHPDLRTMILWDMPGAGTTEHPGSTYFEDKYLQVFDSLIIVTAER